jgi:Tol biopolymer transport system component
MQAMRRFLAVFTLAGTVFFALHVAASSATFAGRNGLIAYAVGGGEESWVMRAIRRDGTHDRRLIGPTRHGGGLYRGPSGSRWSSDGKSLLFGAHSHLDAAAFGLKYATASGKRIKTIPLGLKRPLVLYGWDWAPDGRRVVFAAGDVRGHARIYTIALDGSRRKALGRGDTPTWSSDGRHIVFHRGFASVGNDAKRHGVFIVRPSGRGLRRLTQSIDDSAPSISPDGRQVVYVRTPGSVQGTPQRFVEWRVVDVSGQNDALLVTHDFTTSPYGYRAPQWVPDGRRLGAVREYSVNDLPVAEFVTIDRTGADERAEFAFPVDPSQYPVYEADFSWQPR